MMGVGPAGGLLWWLDITVPACPPRPITATYYKLAGNRGKGFRHSHHLAYHHAQAALQATRGWLGF